MSGCVLREWAGAGSKVGRRGGGEVVDSGELEEAGGGAKESERAGRSS